MSFTIVAERPDDRRLIEPLLDRTFGFERRQKTVYRLRERLDPVPGLCFVALAEDGTLLGSLRFWAIKIGKTPAILLGPLAVEPALQGRGIGKTLVRHGLAEAKRLGHKICVVVGDPSYYRPFGFLGAPAHGLILPGPVEPERFQVMALVPNALDDVHGIIARGKNPASARRRRVA